jgi:hypothetical protein
LRATRHLYAFRVSLISFEARNPELEGRKNLGAEISEVARADRQSYPEE